MTSSNDLEKKWHLIETVPWLPSGLNHSLEECKVCNMMLLEVRMEAILRVGIYQKKHQVALRCGESRSAKCPWPCLCPTGWSGRAKQSPRVPRLQREAGWSLQSSDGVIKYIWQLVCICGFVQLAYLPGILPFLSSHLYWGSVVSICLQNQHITAIWPGLGVCCVCLHLLFVLSTLPALQPQQGTRFLLPVVFLFFLESTSVSKCTMLFLITEELASSWKFSGRSQLRKAGNSVSLGLKASSFFIRWALSLCPTSWLCYLPQRCILW